VTSRLTVAATIAAHNHARCRTYRNPTVRSCHALLRSCSPVRARRTRISAIVTAETANVAASAMNAHPVPNASMTSPPTSGPIKVSATGRTNCASEFASTRRSSGTIVGTIELKAGPKIA